MESPALRRLLRTAVFAATLVVARDAFSAAPATTAAKFTPEQIEYFEKQIRPLLVKHCIECHGPKAQEAGLRLDARSHILTGVEGHPAAVPGDPSKSLIIAVTKYDGDVQMPPDGKLPAEQLAALTNWVKLGLPWPEESSAASKTPAGAKPSQPAAATPWDGSMDQRIARARSEHWAFQPVRRPQPPTVAEPAWNENPIDRFVYAKLAEKGLRPSPPADPRTLVRRAYFDLLGIPPTAEEIDEFVRAGDYAALVDRLLASPLYGERWARHWLDVARYGDTKGYAFQQERRFPFAYTYRDYVIRAFNEDKPYDQFILEQLAADKLPPQKDNGALAALGFLTCGRQFTGLHDTIDDQIDVVTRGLLGLTANCARCHDHKFDPIPTEDYYSLYGVFRSSVAPAEYPPLGMPQPSPEYDAFQKELAKLTAERDAFVGEAQANVIDELRSHASDYLAKIVLDSLDKAGSKEKDFLFDAGDPRPTVVRRWRDMLVRTKRERTPLFVAWHKYDDLPEAEFEKRAPALTAELVKAGDAKSPAVNRLLREALEKNPPKSMLDVAKIYGELFERTYADWKKLQDPKSRKSGAAAPTKLPDPAAEELRQVLFAPNSPTSLGMDESRQIFDRKVRNEVEARQKKVDQLIVTSPGAPPRAMSLVDDGQLFNPYVFVRGDAARRGKDVPRQNLRVLSGDDRKPFSDGSGRLDLARAIASRDNPLTARVMVNRIWLQHFGRGLVDTPSDFGVRTPPPSHPELLDYLAAAFMDEGWSIKRLHRLIMTSQTYRQSSGSAAAPATRSSVAKAQMIDPENRLLWRMNRRRLELEAMRDAMLFAAGRLDVRHFGRPVELWKQPYTTRRTVYGYIDRQDLPGIFGVFDFANPDVTIDQRPQTTVPQQALFAMNSPFVQEQARKLAARPEIAGQKNEAERIAAVYRTALGRAPTADETARVERFLVEAGAAAKPLETWQYGYGALDPAAGRVTRFTHLRHWTGSVWQVAAKFPDDKLGHIILRNNSGHAGRTLDATTIIRWTSPTEGAVALAGTLKHDDKEGDGVIAHAVSSRLGKLGTWAAHNKTASTELARIEVRRGDVIDLVVEPGKTGNHDSFSWTPVLRRVDGSPAEWNYQNDFHGPPQPTLSPWEMLAQVLLMSNEFMFVD